VRRSIVVPSLAVAALLALPAGASAAFAHVVAPGESLSSVAEADGLTVAQLATANGLAVTAELTAGSQLTIPPRQSSLQEPAETTTPLAAEADTDQDADGSTSNVAEPASPNASSQYVVQPGDTLTAIAARAGTTVAQLAEANHLDPTAPLLSGTTLTLGAGTASAAANPAAEASSTASAATSQPVGTAAEGTPEGPPFPTSQTASPAEIASIAAANGVPPSLATAIAYQESGFNNELVSSADARGVMQITPGTWSWIGEALAGSAPLEPASMADNVRGGVLLLHALLHATGGDEALAAAGYYQGLPSVLQNGMYPSTQQYVADVQALQRRFGGE